MVMVLGFFILFVFVVSYVKDLGVFDIKVVFLFIVLGFIDIFVWLVVGFVVGFGKVWFYFVYFFSFFMFFNGFVDLVGFMVGDYGGLVVFCIFFGIFYGMVGVL